MSWNDVQQYFTSTPPTTRANTTYADMHSFSNSRMILTLKISKGYKDKHFEKQNKSRNGCSNAKIPQIRRQDLVFHVECRRWKKKWPNQLHEQWPPHFVSYPNALTQIEARHFCFFALTLTSNIPKFYYLLSSRKTCSPDSFGHQPQPQTFQILKPFFFGSIKRYQAMLCRRDLLNGSHLLVHINGRSQGEQKSKHHRSPRGQA